ncbi:MAG TPA: LysR family transcriptional regulator [Paraburkholderia sp.]|nr:LysR family transcriptional regulator [Paraburkholderia sp.]
MESRDLDYLLAVAERGSVLRAAEQLGVTQPAVTKAIARLEREFDLPLFERGPRGMVPTAAGAALIARARKIRLEHDDALRELAEMRAGTIGLVRFGFSPTVDAALVFGACNQLLRERPAARFHLRERLGGELLDALQGGEIDLAVARIPEAGIEDVAQHVLYTDQLYVVADAEHPLAHKRGIGLAELTREEWILPPQRVALRQQIETAFRAQGLPPPVLRVEIDSNHHAMFELVRGSRCLSLCGPNTLKERTHLRPLAIRAESLDLHRRIGILHRRHAYLTPIACRLIDILKARGGELSAPPDRAG